MNETRAFASLSPGLLARKGGAKPAMRPQIQPLSEFHDQVEREMEEDLGWNDMGTDLSNDLGDAEEAEATSAQVLPLHGNEPVVANKPDIVMRQQNLDHQLSATAASRRSALAEGRRAAFTLRIDAERHLKLRLASTVTNRSAQQLVTEALDHMLESMPELESLAAKVRKRS